MGGVKSVVTIKNCAVATLGFRINYGKWNWIPKNDEGKYSTKGVTFTGWVKDQANVPDSSSRSGMNSKGKYCAVVQDGKVQLVDETGCGFYC